MTTETYNGWTNWETWNVALWIDNDESLYRQRCRTSQWDSGMVSEFVQKLMPDGTPDMDCGCELNKVDWHEIAESWNDED